MISSITINKIASYKSPVTISDLGRFNLFYGINGSGKSTIARYFYDMTNTSEFGLCSVHPSINPEEIELIVFTQRFVEDNFFAVEDQPGIFTLSKTNREALKRINELQAEVSSLYGKISNLNIAIEKLDEEIGKKRKSLIEKLWNIKTHYAGGDRVLEYCLVGVKDKKESVLNKLMSIPRPNAKPTESIDDIKNQISVLNNSIGRPALPLSEIDGHRFQTVESDRIFGEAVVGSSNSLIGQYINKLGSGDWVREGLKYLPKSIPIESKSACPFCQQDTITPELLDSLKAYFDASYEDSIKQLKSLKCLYQSLTSSIEVNDSNITQELLSDVEDKYLALKNKLSGIFRANKNNILNKLRNPSGVVSLESTLPIVTEMNELIKNCNMRIRRFNEDLANINEKKSQVCRLFWEINRWEYDDDISQFRSLEQKLRNVKTAKMNELSALKQILAQKNCEIATEQAKTVSMDETVNKINRHLEDFGIVDFKIVKTSSNMFKITRESENDLSKVFNTLSEGEKTVISFLYFIEVCLGKRESSASPKKRIVIIDDPISSLTQAYVYNIAYIIVKSLIEQNGDLFDQFFFLTHSVYFYGELKRHSDKLAQTAKEFRVVKLNSSSQVIPMGKDEIRDSYQAHWEIVKDTSSKACPYVANSMRHILEQFFGFVEGDDMKKLFGRKEIDCAKYQDLYRFVNEESHGTPYITVDIKSLDYEKVKAEFKDLFYSLNYAKHYDKMMGN